MNPPRTFRCPRDILWGRGSLARLEMIGRKRVLIVTEKELKAFYPGQG
ncbi:MAG: iron-containing alcohol dehydrogenase [Deltaproteobacteria bacterium]|nr:iron-containing alcohol dehydrogenase [Deltaproteobacteria bacterium]